MEEYRFKEVYFNGYCHDCVHKDKDESEEPCDECLENSVNEYSHKPVNFKKQEKKEKKDNG